MYKSNIRKVGGSMMLAIPPAILDLLSLSQGSVIQMAVENDRLIIEAVKKPSYQLDDLLSQCNPDAPISEEDKEWLNAPSVGREII
jgi:antitoxin ChpS